jgi:hypothetical protein
VVGRGEVAGGSAVLLKFLVVVELGAVVEGDGVPEFRSYSRKSLICLYHDSEK